MRDNLNGYLLADCYIESDYEHLAIVKAYVEGGDVEIVEVIGLGYYDESTKNNDFVVQQTLFNIDDREIIDIAQQAVIEQTEKGDVDIYTSASDADRAMWNYAEMLIKQANY